MTLRVQSMKIFTQPFYLSFTQVLNFLKSFLIIIVLRTKRMNIKICFLNTLITLLSEFYFYRMPSYIMSISLNNISQVVTTYTYQMTQVIHKISQGMFSKSMFEWRQAEAESGVRFQWRASEPCPRLMQRNLIMKGVCSLRPEPGHHFPHLHTLAYISLFFKLKLLHYSHSKLQCICKHSNTY